MYISHVRGWNVGGRQTLFITATWPAEIEGIARDFLQVPPLQGYLAHKKLPHPSTLQ